MTWFVPESPEELRPHHGHPVMDLSSSHTPWADCENTPVRKIQRGLGVGLISPRVAATLLPIACQGNNERFRMKAQLINFSYPAPIGVQQLAASHRWFDLCARF